MVLIINGKIYFHRFGKFDKLLPIYQLLLNYLSYKSINCIDNPK